MRGIDEDEVVFESIKSVSLEVPSSWSALLLEVDRLGMVGMDFSSGWVAGTKGVSAPENDFLGMG